MKMQNRLLSNILINKRFQLSILGWFIFLSLLMVGCFYLSNWFFFKVMEQEALAAGLDGQHVFFKFLADQKSLMNKIFAVTSVISTIIIILGGLILSHKVAGPLTQLTQHLRKHPLKSMVPVKFRKGDYFPEIEEAFNNSIEASK